ncbi:UNVERIFIED_CONTAM: hypothetical protein FKN15_054805 [Acipenser sinensis]
MASIPSVGSLVATHDYYRRRLGSNSSSGSCGSSEYAGEVIPHHPGKQLFVTEVHSYMQCLHHYCK